MPIISDKELPEAARAKWLKAFAAAEIRNFDYSISLIMDVLKHHPGFLDGRKRLRQIEIIATEGKKSFLSGLSTANLKGGSILKKDPLAAMEFAEESLKSDPYNAHANNLLKDAAKAAGYPEIAVFALETLVKGHPKDTKLLHELGEYYVLLGQSDKAVTTYTRITEINPADLVALKRSKDASANATMKQGGWGTAESFRDLMKNKEEAETLEMQSRVFKDPAIIDGQLAELGQEYEKQPESVDIVRRIASLYDQKQQITETIEDLDEAVRWYEYTNTLTKGVDPAVARKCTDLQMRQLDTRIKSFETWLSQGGDQTEDAQKYQEELASLKAQKAGRLISEARRRVDKNPTDLQLRFELGEQLMLAGNDTEAIPELQRAKQSPNARLKAMSLLGQCFLAKGMVDMAITQFKTAASEITGMDVVKKDVLYKLGLAYEKLGNRTEYISAMKEIYEVDYGYLDVAARVEKSYSE